MIKFVFIFLISLNLSSCVNQFNVDSDTATQLANININVTEESVPAYEFTTHLKNILNSTNDPNNKYKLDIIFNKTSSSLAIQKDADPIRDSIELVIVYKLYDNKDSSLLYSDKFRQISSYNMMFSPFSANIEAQRAYYSLFRTSAEELRRRLILYFKRSSLS